MVGSTMASDTSVSGYEGGRWENGHFFYNTAVNRVDANAIHNVYNTTGERER